MSATARKHDVDPVDPGDGAVGSDQGTEYATRGMRGLRAGAPAPAHGLAAAPGARQPRRVRAVVTGLLGVGMVLILVINTSLAQGAFTISELQAQQSTLTQQEQTLAEAVAAAAAPENLEQQARALGMVPSENPVFLDVTTGTVLGEPKAAGGATSSVPRLLTPADATATEAVDNASVGTDLPIAPGPDYDPAAADAAAAQAAAANADALRRRGSGCDEGRSGEEAPARRRRTPLPRTASGRTRPSST